MVAVGSGGMGVLDGKAVGSLAVGLDCTPSCADPFEIPLFPFKASPANTAPTPKTTNTTTAIGMYLFHARVGAGGRLAGMG